MAPRSSARSRRKGCTRQSRSVSAGFTVDEPEATPGDAIKLAPRYASRGAEIVALLAPLRRPPTRQSVAAPAATMQPQDSSLCGGCAIYSFSPHTATKVIMPARGDAKETKRSLVGDYRGEYWR
jgi:hypothetical protein